MIPMKLWWTVVLVPLVVVAVLLSILTGFLPGLHDLTDPLGSPSKVGLTIIKSTDDIDRITAALVPKHSDLAQRAQIVKTLASDLDNLVGKAGELAPAAVAVNNDVRSVQGVATPLPQLISNVTGRANQATPTVAALGAAVGSVTYQLELIGNGLGSAQGSLGALGPRASSIVGSLELIEAETARLRPVGPLLSYLARLVNGTGSSPGLLGGTNSSPRPASGGTSSPRPATSSDSSPGLLDGVLGLLGGT
jgi:hypothetical protein